MKKALPQIFLSTCIISWLLFSQGANAQCLCSGGSPANSEEYLVTLAPTSQSNTVISFPKFDPEVGTLTCVTLYDTISIVSTTGIRNYDPAQTEYEFQMTVNTQLTGPSLSRTNFKNSQYGPDILEAFGNPGDSINYGPDSIYNNWPSQRTNTTNMTPYLGATGTVDFTYTIGGGVIAVGGANYNAQVRTTTWGTFKLTYYYCPNSVLASAVRNLSVTRSGDVVELQWQGPENSGKDNFKIEISNDGKEFTTLKQRTGTDIIERASAKYEYRYRPDRFVDQKLYFRIKYQHDNQVKYSEMKWLLPGNAGRPQLTLYPNPVVRSIRMQLEDRVSGDVVLEVTNQAGQVVLRRNFRMDSNMAEVPVTDPPLPGLYFVRLRATTGSKVYSGKLLFTR